MPVAWYAVAIFLLGVLAIVKRDNRRVRNLVVVAYSFFTGLFAFAVYVAWHRASLFAIRDAGLAWTGEARQIVVLLHEVYASWCGLLLLLILVLVLLVLRPPR
jgi:hypothetical protein